MPEVLRPDAAADAGLDAGVRPDGGMDGGAGPDGGLPLSSACFTLNERRCAYLLKCGLIDASETAMRDCMAYFTATWCGPTRWPPRVLAGTLRYDALAAESCARSFDERACADWQTDPEACQRMLAPNSFLNQRCYGGYLECRQNLTCRGSTCETRRCQPPGAVGESCDEGSDCRADLGLYCRLSATGTGVGSCAEYGQFLSSCGADAPCAESLFCNNRLQCETRRQVGQDCVAGSCVADAYCQLSADGGTCVQRAEAGQACSDDVQCSAGLICRTPGGTCELLGPIPAGQPCSLRQICAAGNTCVGATANQLGRCDMPLASGQSCVSSVDCQSHLACNPSDGGSVCGPRRPAGSSCGLDRDCMAFARCVAGTCTELPVPGPQVSCVAGGCLWGRCEHLADGGTHCADYGGPGQSCVSDAECASNRCLSGRCVAPCNP